MKSIQLNAMLYLPYRHFLCRASLAIPKALGRVMGISCLKGSSKTIYKPVQGVHPELIEGSFPFSFPSFPRRQESHPLTKGFKLLIFCLFSLITFATYSQTIITYTYDVNGNRIERKVEPSSREAVAQDTENLEEEDGAFEEENLLYPNPTNGVLRFTLSLETPANSEVSIFDLQGRQVYQNRFEQQEFQVDIAEHKNGVYVVRWRFADQSRTAKIIKQ